MFTTIDMVGQGQWSTSPAAIPWRQPCNRPSGTTNDTGWRNVIGFVRTLSCCWPSVCGRFGCEWKDRSQGTFDERFEGSAEAGRRSGRWRSSPTWLGRAPRAVARNLGEPEHYLRLAVGARRRLGFERGAAGDAPSHR